MSVLGAAQGSAAARKVRFAAFQVPSFRPFFGFTMQSMMGDNIEHVITYWVLFQTFHSPLLMGYAIISHWVPPLLLSVYAGSLADRYDCRRLMQLSQGLFIFVSFGWAMLFATNSLQEWHAVVLLTLHGLAGTFWGPADQMLVYDIVGPEQLPSGVRLLSTARQLGMLLGPGVGGLILLPFAGPTVGMFVNMLNYVPMMIWAQRIPYTGHGRQGATARRGLGLGDAFGVFREVANDRVLVAMIVMAGLTSFLIGTGYTAQMPEFAQDLGTDAQGFQYGILLAANAAGAVAGGFLLEWSDLLPTNVRTGLATAAAWCFLMAGFALSSSFELSVVMLFLAGVLQLAYMAIAQTLVQILAPDQIRGRVIGLYNMAFSGLRFGAGITLGVFGTFVGIHGALVVSAAVLLLGLAALLAYVQRGPALAVGEA